MFTKATFALLSLLVAVHVFGEAPGGKRSSADGNCLQTTSEKDGLGVHVLPGTHKKLYSYNVDAKPAKEHKALCVSQSGLDSVLWHHGDGTGCFTITPKLVTKKNEAGEACPAYPFTRALPNTCMHMHHSEHARKDAIGCSYDMVFQRQDGSSADPHIVIGH